MAPAQANDSSLPLINWNTGLLFIEKSPESDAPGAVARFQDGTSVSLANVVVEERIIPTTEQGLPPAENSYWVFSVPTPVEPKREASDPDANQSEGASPAEVLSEILRIPKVFGHGPFPELKILYNPESSRLVWIFEPYSHVGSPVLTKVNSRQPSLTWATSTVDRLGTYGKRSEVRIKGKVPIVLRAELPSGRFVGAAAFEWNSKLSIGSIYIYSTEENMIQLWRVTSADESNFAAASAESSLLPADEKNALNQMRFDPETFWPVLVGENDESFNFGERSPAPSAQKDNDRDASRLPVKTADQNQWIDPLRSLRERYRNTLGNSNWQWLRGGNQIRKYLDARFESNSRPSLISIQADAEKWQKTIALGYRIGSTNLPTGDRLRESNLLVELSRDANAALPQLRFDAIRQILDSFESVNGSRQVKEVFYVTGDGPSGTAEKLIDTILKNIPPKQEGRDKAFLVIVDLVDTSSQRTGTVAYSLGALSARASAIRGTDASGPQVSFAVLLSGDNEDSGVRKYYTHHTNRLPFEVCIDSKLQTEHFLGALSSALHKREVNIAPKLLSGMLEAIRAEHPEWSARFVSISELANQIVFILRNANLDVTSEGLGLEIAQVYNQLHGARSLAFDANAAERINRLFDRLSADGAAPMPEPLIGLDDEIRLIQDIFREKRGQKRLATLPFLFFGPGGTGKTLLATNIPESLGSVRETLNVSTLVNPRSGGTLDLGPLNSAIQRLHLHSNGVKTLVLEEIEKAPSIFPHLMAALDPQQKGSKTVNLDGLVVIMTANMRKETEKYKQLVQLSSSEKSDKAHLSKYNELKFEVAVEALSGGNADEKQTAEALAGRFFKGLVFVPPIKDVQPHVKDKNIGHLVKTIEREQGIKLILSDAARAHLRKTLDDNAKGNYRTAFDAICDALRLAITNFKDEHPGLRRLARQYVLTEEKGLDGRPALRLGPVDESNVALIGGLVNDYLVAYNRVLIGAVDEAIGVISDDLRRANGSDPGLAFHFAKLKRFAESMRMLSKHSLYSKDAPKLPANVMQWSPTLPLPLDASHKKSSALREIFETTFLPVFANVAPQGLKSTNTVSSSVSNRELASNVFLLVGALDELREKDAAHFDHWAQTTLAAYQRLTGENIHVDLSKADATSVLAALLANDMGRRYSREYLLTLIPKSNTLNAVDATAAAEQSNGPSRSERCQNLLKGFGDKAKRLEDIFRK